MNDVARGAQTCDIAIVDFRSAPSTVHKNKFWQGGHAFRKEMDGRKLQVEFVAGKACLNVRIFDEV